MIASWSSYSVEDFLPFTARTFFRLIERHNEALWPWQLVMLACGLVVGLYVLAGSNRRALFLLGVVWVAVGTMYFFRSFSELIWVAEIFGWIFVAQGVLLGGAGLTGWAVEPGRRTLRTVSGILGVGLAAVGLLLYPVAGLVGAESGWLRAEGFGVFPEPTAVTTLGLLFLLVRGPWIWVFLLLPILWCLVGGTVLWGLGAWQAWLPVSAAAIALGGAVSTIFQKPSPPNTTRIP